MPSDAAQACSFIGCNLQSLFRPGCCDRRAIGLASHWVLLAGGTVNAPGPWRAWSWVSFYTWRRLRMLCTDSQVKITRPFAPTVADHQRAGPFAWVSLSCETLCTCKLRTWPYDGAGAGGDPCYIAQDCCSPDEKHQSSRTRTSAHVLPHWMIGHQTAEHSAEQMCILSALLCTPLVQLPCICARPLSMVPAPPAPPPRADCPKPFAGRTPSHGQISPHQPGDGLGTASMPGPQTDVAHVPPAGGAAYMDTPNAELPPS